MIRLLVLALFCSTASAAQPPEVEAFRRARRLFEARRYVRAAVAFEAAYRLRPHYLVLCSIARCHENLNDMVQAAGYYQRCLEQGAGETNLARRIRASLAAVEGQISWVRVQSPGRGGTVYINGKEIGPAPGRYPVNPGRHMVEVRRPGARPASKSVVTLGGEGGSVQLVPLDLTPITTVISGPTSSEPDPQPSRRGLHQAWFWITTVTTVALATTTAVLGAQTLQRRATYEDNPSEMAYEGFTRHRMLTNIFGAATAVAGGGGLVLFFYTDFGDHRRPSPDAPRDSYLGLQVNGAF